MERMISFFKKLNLPKIAIALVAGFALLVSTACSGESSMQTSRQEKSNNIPIQMGANNNPYTMGNDTNGQPTSPSNYGNQAYKKRMSDASSQIARFNPLIASSVAGQDTTGLLYESADQQQGGIDNTRPTQEQAYQSEGIPSRRQPVVDRSNPNEKIMEGIGQQFTEASKFLTDGVQPAVESAKVKTYTGSNQAVAKQSDQDH